MSCIPSDRPANFTRTSPSFVRRFIREGRIHLIPVYWLLSLSDFAREGMANSGSYRFADHMYRGVPSGRGFIGRWLDRVLLNLPAARSMRKRCFASTAAMHRAFTGHLARGTGEPFRILTVPCGLPRDVRDFVSAIAKESPEQLAMISYKGMDLDPKVVAEARQFMAGSRLVAVHVEQGNALVRDAYPAEAPHFVASTGLGEFLDDAALAIFYGNVFESLAPGGTFFTSAAAQDSGSNRLLKTFEFEIFYRSKVEVSRALAGQSWAEVELTNDRIGLQTFVRAVKPLEA